MSYIGRFAPSPSGPLHAGSLVAALASWLDARAFGGRWLVRIEDVDGPRTMPGAAEIILQQLAALGLVPDDAPVFQSERGALYQAALARLVEHNHAYRCGCTRREIDDALGPAWTSGEERIYPGTCRHGLNGKPPRAWRLRVDDEVIHWFDRRLGAQSQNVAHAVGDFVLQRADGPWAYQLAVVVDDAAQGITHVVRGEDLADNTARQIYLQRLLGLPIPKYLHTPLVVDTQGRKLSKSNGAAAVDTHDAVAVLREAASHLGLTARGATLTELLNEAVLRWPNHYTIRSP